MLGERLGSATRVSDEGFIQFDGDDLGGTG
jgi:hypothetical protein